MTRIIHQSLNTKNLFSSSLYLKATFDNIHLFYFLVIHAFGHLQIYAEIFTFPNKCSNYKNSDVHTRNSFPFCISTFQRFIVYHHGYARKESTCNGSLLMSFKYSFGQCFFAFCNGYVSNVTFCTLY